MKTKLFRISSVVILVILILVMVTLTAGAIAKSVLAKQHPAPGQLVDVGGYKLHIHCTGQGSPTVILDAGLGDFSATWGLVQPEVTNAARVCSYDRAGYGWSDPSPRPRTINMMAEELHTLLLNANIQGPYVLVGHSLGGLIVRVYTHNYPDEVVGMVLVDSTHEEQYLRLATAVPKYVDVQKSGVEQANGQYRLFRFLSSTGMMALIPQSIPNPGFSDDVFDQYKSIWATTAFFETILSEGQALEGILAEARALHITNFGDLPLIVLSAEFSGSNPDFSDAQNQQLGEIQRILQSDLLALSSNSKQIIAEQSSHYIQSEQPELVIDAIREMVDTLRK